MSNQENIGWYFQIDNTGSYRGFNNPDLERFKKGRYKSLTREVIQNSLDAVSDFSKPVRVEFKLERLNISDLPQAGELKAKLKGCLQMAPRDKNHKDAVPWFGNAIKLLDEKAIDVLKMSDYNTTGMVGPCELGNPFYAYMKTMGSNAKSDRVVAAGGHGIGKRAPLLSSKLRSLIASTTYLDRRGKKAFLSQGFSLLISHEEALPSGEKRMLSHEGYWGVKNGCQPISNPELISEPLRRQEVGTDIFLLGFDRAKNWEEKIAAHALTNFFAAFARGTLEFRVGSIEITKDNIASHFDNLEHYVSALDDEEEKELLRNAEKFFLTVSEAQTAYEVKVETAELDYLKHVELRIIIAENMPQQFALIRRNMLIVTELPNLKRFPNYKDFVAVIECKSPEGEMLIKSIEPSRHDSLEVDQIEDENERRKARIAIKQFTDFIRKSIRRHAQDSTMLDGSVDFLSQFFADETESGADKAEYERDPAGRIIITPRKLPEKGSFARPSDAVTGGGGASGTSASGSGQESTGGASTGTGMGSSGSSGATEMKNYAISPRVIERGSQGHKLAFGLPKAGEFKVSVKAVGLDGDDHIDIVQSSSGTLTNGFVLIKNTAVDARISLDIKLKRASEGAYRIVCEEVI